MTDRISVQRRSWNMSRIKSKDTTPEIRARSTLHKLGYRFRLHRIDLPGCPDIVLAKYRKVIFVHGCYWHRHEGCKQAYSPKSRVKFWEEKFRQNVERDRRSINELEELGWQVHVIWECQTKDLESLALRIDRFFR